MRANELLDGLPGKRVSETQLLHRLRERVSERVSVYELQDFREKLKRGEDWINLSGIIYWNRVGVDRLLSGMLISVEEEEVDSSGWEQDMREGVKGKVLGFSRAGNGRVMRVEKVGWAWCRVPVRQFGIKLGDTVECEKKRGTWWVMRKVKLRPRKEG